MELLGTYCGVVENVKDPEKLGRVKVRVPHVFGFIGQNDIPWALPAGMPAGNSAASGGFSHLPEVGDQVFVRFLDGEPEKPIWEWGNQTTQGAKALKLHQYQAQGKTVGPPRRAAWTRYSHTLELNKDGIIVTTSQGYNLSLTDGDGVSDPNGIITLSTPKGAMLEIDDDGGDWTAYVIEDLYLNIGDTINAIARSLDFTITDSFNVDVGTDVDMTVGSTVDLEAGGDITVTTVEELLLNFRLMRMNGGVEPFVLGTQLVTFLESLLTWLTTHTHGNGNLGSPTTPPIIPPTGVVQPEPTTLISETIFGQ
jgi:hypothetical protein